MAVEGTEVKNPPPLKTERQEDNETLLLQKTGELKVEDGKRFVWARVCV